MTTGGAGAPPPGTCTGTTMNSSATQTSIRMQREYTRRQLKHDPSPYGVAGGLRPEA